MGKIKRIAVMTSGGDAPGMNAAIRAVVRKSIFLGIDVIGYHDGFQGIIDGDHIHLDLSSVGGIIDEGGTFLGTARSDEFMTSAGQDKAARTLKRDQVDGLIVIGGDGSFRGAERLQQRGIATVGIPGTIDNDIAGTDYAIGFDTALNTVLDAISKIRDTASSHERVFVIEVMGRHSGMIALHAGLAGGADLVIIPEYPMDMDSVCLPISRGFARGKLHCIIVVAEGAASGPEVASGIKDCAGHEVKVSVLGHIQRGGSPTAFDRILASRLGAKAVDELLEGDGGIAVGLAGGKLVSNKLEYSYSNRNEIEEEMFKLVKILAL